MNTKEYIMMINDGPTGNDYYIRPKYMVMEASVGGAPGTTFLWVKCVGYGIDTEAHYEEYKRSLDSDMTAFNPSRENVKGVLGEYQVVALSAVEPYSGLSNHNGPFPIG